MLKKFLSKLSLKLISAGVAVTRVEKKLYGSVLGLPPKPDKLERMEDVADAEIEDDPMPVLEPLPDEVVFRAMFERKFGKFGTCPIQVSGQQKLLNSEEMYAMLEQIQERAKENDIKTDEDEFLVQLYTVLLSIIVRGQGEVLDESALN